jgi:hypothetical protein
VRRNLDDRGSVSAFVAVIAIALVAVAGLVYDGGQILTAQARVRDSRPTPLAPAPSRSTSTRCALTSGSSSTPIGRPPLLSTT